MRTKHTSCYKSFLEIKMYLKTKIKTKSTVIDKTKTDKNICIRNLDTNKEREKANLGVP